MKKIMIIHRATSYGGATLSLKDIIDMLIYDYQIVLYLPIDSRHMSLELFSDSKIQVKMFRKQPPMFAHYSGINAIVTPGFWRGLLSWINKKYWQRLIKIEGADAVLVNSSVLSPMAGIIKKANAKAICFNRETHNMICFGLFNLIMRKILQRMDMVFFLSDSEREHFKIQNALTVPDVFNYTYFSKPTIKSVAREELELDKEDFIILFLGGISRLKGTEIALKALKRLEHFSAIKMIVLGDLKSINPTRKKTENFIYFLIRRKEKIYIKKCQDLLASTDNVILFGIKKDIGLFYSAADVLIFPSSKSHQARPLYESGFYSLPVIISDFEEIKEYAINYVNAIYFKPNDSDNLVEKIIELYDNRMLLKKLGEKNRQMTFRLHSFLEQRKKLISSIEKLFE